MNKKLLFIIVLFVTVCTLCSCKGGSYMEDYVDVQWICDDIDMQFTYTSDNPEMGVGTLVKDNDSLDIVCFFSLSKHIEIYDKAIFDTNSEYIGADSALIVGHYELSDDVAKVTIVKDNLYDGDYLNKVIYLQMTHLD